jgi:predicted acylesterase/phospholipase RssA
MVDSIHLDRNAVVTIQGGGLYGVTLLGQLRAAVEAVDILAIAGSSAGAVIAALVWAGWSPDDLYAKFREQARLRILYALPGDFDGEPTPFEFRDWVALTRDLMSVSAAAVRMGGQRRLGSVLATLNFYYDLLSVFRRLRPHYAKRGFFKGNQLERVVEDLLRQALSKKGYSENLPNHPLTFGDFRKLALHADAYFPPLILAATNLGTQNVELINSIESKYDNVSVARAVRASAGYPVFFRPVDIPEIGRGNWYIDGGVISNFPAWAFSREFREKMRNSEFRTTSYRPWTHVGLRLVDEDIKDPDTGEILPLFDFEQLERPSIYLSALSRLLFGQARNRLEDLISETLARSIVVAQPYEQSAGPHHLFDFDAVNERRICCMYEAGAAFGKQKLKHLRFEIAGQSSAAIARLMESLANRTQSILDPRNAMTDLRVRANIFLADKDILRLYFATNMKDPTTGQPDPDVNMCFTAPDQGLTGFCFTLRRPLICNLAEIGRYVQNAGKALFNMNEEQQSMVLRQQSWLASMPILDPNDLVFRESLLADIRTEEGLFATPLDIPMDGPIFGVLNVDANIDYEALKLSPDPSDQTDDSRISVVVDMMQCTAMRVGQILANDFAAFPTGEQSNA